MFPILFGWKIGASSAFAGTPHAAYGTVRYVNGSKPTTLQFSAYLTANPSDTLTQSSAECGYAASTGQWVVQCGNFSTSWKAGDLLHVDFNDGAGKTGSIEVTLTNDPDDNAGVTTLTVTSTVVKLLIADATVLRGSSVEIPVALQGLGVADSVLAYQIKVGFDADVLLAVGAENGGTMTERWVSTLATPRETEMTVGGFTTNTSTTQLVPDAGILVKLKFIPHGIPSSQTSNSTIVRFLEATIYTLTKTIIVSHAKSGAVTVVNNPINVTKEITLYPNWNLLSLAISPDPNNTPDVFGGVPINFVYGYWPGEGATSWENIRPSFLNDLKIIDGLHGYWMRLNAQASQVWNVSGDSIDVTTPILLYSGWNLIGYLPTSPDSITHAFESLDTLYSNVIWFDALKSKARNWDRWSPIFLNDNILSPLLGYWVKMTAAENLIYPSSGYRVLKSVLGVQHIAMRPDTFPIVTPWFCDFWGLQPNVLFENDTIDVLDSDDVLCGRTLVTAEGGFLVHVFGDDANTPDVDEGAVEGDTLQFIINGNLAVVSRGDGTWTYRNSKEIELSQDTNIPNNEQIDYRPESYNLLQNYPNPFNTSTIIKFDVRDKSYVSLNIVDVLGRHVRTLLNYSERLPGIGLLVWDGSDDEGERVSSGIYFVHLQVGHLKFIKKMLLIY